MAAQLLLRAECVGCTLHILGCTLHVSRLHVGHGVYVVSGAGRPARSAAPHYRVCCVATRLYSSLHRGFTVLQHDCVRRGPTCRQRSSSFSLSFSDMTSSSSALVASRSARSILQPTKAARSVRACVRVHPPRRLAWPWPGGEPLRSAQPVDVQHPEYSPPPRSEYPPPPRSEYPPPPHSEYPPTPRSEYSPRPTLSTHPHPLRSVGHSRSMCNAAGRIRHVDAEWMPRGPTVLLFIRWAVLYVQPPTCGERKAVRPRATATAKSEHTTDCMQRGVHARTCAAV